MDETVRDFYKKENRPNYFEKYEQEHGARLDFCVHSLGLGQIRDAHVADYGCGYGFLLQRLHDSNIKVGFDGADIDLSQIVQPSFILKRVDLNTGFSSSTTYAGVFDYSFCFETLEHLENPYRCLVEVKRQAKLGSSVFLSIPHEGMTHNTVYPGLIYPETNFEDFLGQMALPVVEKMLYHAHWPSWIYRCCNLEWHEARMKFPKPQFVGRMPVEYTNL